MGFEQYVPNVHFEQILCVLFVDLLTSVRVKTYMHCCSSIEICFGSSSILLFLP